MNNFYKNLPKKRVAAGALFFNDKKELLLVKPTYKDYWSIPGGVSEAEESPKEACVREVKEELGFDCNIGKLLCVDYKEDKIKGESLQFIFYGGTLNPEQTDKISLPPEEIREYRFVPINKALNMVSQGLSKRIENTLELINNKNNYLENGNIK